MQTHDDGHQHPAHGHDHEYLETVTDERAHADQCGLRPARLADVAQVWTAGAWTLSGWCLVGVVALAACGAAPEERVTRSVPRSTTIPTVAFGPPPVEVRVRIERRTTDPATEGFVGVVRDTLADPRGWSGAGFALVEDPDASLLVVLAEGAEVDQLCAPYRTGGRFSCQNGPVVAMNADRWRLSTPQWTGTLAAYRQMLVNHEVGHLLGRHHPPGPSCPAPGLPATVMSQQSTELDGCLPNPWPLPAEVAAAARHDEPLAPPYEG